MSSSIYSSTLLHHLSLLLPEAIKDQAEAIKGSIVVATSYAHGTDARIAIDTSYLATMRQLHWWSLGTSLLAVVVVWGMKDLKLSDGEEEKQRQEPDERERLLG
jgi:hypothetical protein